MIWIEVLLDGLLLTAITLGASLLGSPFFQKKMSEDSAGKASKSGNFGNSREPGYSSGPETSREPGKSSGPVVAQNRKENRRITIMIYGICVVFTILRVYLAYSGQENSDYFFWHPYLAWLFADVMWILVKRGSLGKNGLLQRLLLWPFLVIPVFSGLSLAIGWLMKLYLRYILPV